MATTPEYNEFVCERLEPFGAVRSRKMFGEYMVYLNDKPIITVCDNTVFVKILPELAAYLNDAERGFPYDGAKLHCILDIEDSELLSDVIPILEAFTPLPKPRKRKGNKCQCLRNLYFRRHFLLKKRGAMV